MQCIIVVHIEELPCVVTVIIAVTKPGSDDDVIRVQDAAGRESASTVLAQPNHMLRLHLTSRHTYEITTLAFFGPVKKDRTIAS